MKVAIDVSGALGTRGGIHMYLQQLINRMPKVQTSLDIALYALFWNGFPEKFSNFQLPKEHRYELLLRRWPQKYVLYLENVWNLRLQEPMLRRKRVDLFHGACQILPVVKRMKTVLTAHHFENPRYAFLNRWQHFYFKEVMERSARSADHLIADSHFTKRYLMESLGITPERVTVIYHGAPDIAAPADQGALQEELRKTYGIQTPFIVCVSHVNKRKNITGLLKAFQIFLKRIGTPVQLVVVGQQEPNYFAEIQEILKDPGLQGRVIFTGGLPPSEVLKFYFAAELFALPSFLEGFGIPLVEAMKCGCPIVTSNTTCIPEVVGDAGVLVNPEDTEAIAGAITQVFSDAALRERLIAAGRRRADQFSWDVAAQKTIQTYEKVLGQS